MQDTNAPAIQHKPNTFFLEMILSIAFLALAAGVLVQLFVGAHLASVDSGDIGNAVMATQNAAACFKGADARPDELAGMLGGSADDEGVHVWYDESMTAGGADSIYHMVIKISGGPLYEAQITFLKGEKTVYELQTALYRPEGGSHE